jgi:hypothetical protein
LSLAIVIRRLPIRGRAFVLTALVLLGGCRNKQQAPMPEPRLRTQPDRLDLGRATQDQAMTGTVVIRNSGTRPLKVGAIDSSRFCTGRIQSNVVAPGQATNLAVNCRSDLYGPLREAIDIHSNDPWLPKATLQIVADVTPLFAFEVPAIDLKMPFGEERSHDVQLVGSLAARAHPRLTSTPSADSEIEPLAAQAGAPHGYRLRCLGRKVGANAGNIVVATGLDKPREVAIPYVCNVKGTLDVSPTNPFFNLRVSGDKAVPITVRSSQPNFEVREVRATAGPFAARFAHAEDDNTYRIDVTVLNDRIADEARTAVGTLLIVSNDRSEPRKEVPLFGSGRINKVAAPNESRP